MSSWFYLEGRFDGVTEKKTLQNGTPLATFSLTEEARGKQEEATFSLTAFKDVATSLEFIKQGMPIVAKCKLDARSYKDKNGVDRRSTEIKAFAVYLGATPSVAAAPKESQFIPF